LEVCGTAGLETCATQKRRVRSRLARASAAFTIDSDHRVSFQVSGFRFQLSAFSFQLSAFSFPLSAFSFPPSLHLNSGLQLAARAALI
jgi:hypothetical protein